MLLDLPKEVRYIVWRNLTPQDVGHSVVSLSQKPSLLSNTQHQVLAVSQTIRDEFLPLLYNKRSVELHASPWFNSWPIQRKGLAFTYQASGEAPWVTEFLQDLGSDAKFLAKIKIVQTLHGPGTIHYSKVWEQPLKAICEKLQSCCDIQFQPGEFVLFSPTLHIDIAFWDDPGCRHYLQAKVSNQRGPELVFEYQLEPQKERWTMRHVEELCAIHRSVWKLSGQRFDLH